MEPIVSLKGIMKSFPGVQALKNVSIDIYPGEIHALMGENGAGKSTLVKILSGMYGMDQGEITYKGKKVVFSTIAEGLKAGISMVHQELTPIEDMTISENIFLGRESVHKLTHILDRKELNKKTRVLLQGLDIHLEPSKKMHELSVAELQLVEIAKVVSLNSDLVIMDEPTSAISDREVEMLFTILNKLKSEGVAIIYISHKLDEIFRISDRITVLRDGELIRTCKAEELTPNELITLMVGRELKEQFPKCKAEIGEVVLEVENYSKANQFSNVSFLVKKGEILGIAGLMGAGRTELVETIFGLRKPEAGKLKMHGKTIVIRSPKDAIRYGIAFVPEDRKMIGLNLISSVKDNITLTSLKNYCRYGFVNREKERKIADESIERLRISTPHRAQRVSNLSGGNQQKVVIAKWLLTNAEVVIMDEPTRGIDVGAKAEIYTIISDLARQGKAVIMISSEMPEIIGMSDRVIVLSEGRITGEIKRNELAQERIMAMAAGFEKG
jgi:inositol transport system ATP-binding protein